MIPATELRIGNLLSVYGTNGTPNGWIDIAIDAQHILTCVSNPELFKPIPITRDWLLKRGALIHEGKTFIYIGLSPEIRFYKYNDVWICDNGIPETDMVKLPYKVQYAHQLQNLYFALKGEELPIK